MKQLFQAYETLTISNLETAKSLERQERSREKSARSREKSTCPILNRLSARPLRLSPASSMFPIHEIFYSLQGEGFYTGTPSIFIRFSGCNLRCPFCDTEHQTHTMMSADEILATLGQYPAQRVVLTGGEPSLFVTSELIDKLHAASYYVAIETNGTHTVPLAIDWITLSPKDSYLPASANEQARLVLTYCDELKLIYDGRSLPTYPNVTTRHRYLQPCDTGNATENARLTAEAVEYCLAHPEWSLSLQTHKLLQIP